MHVRHRLGLAAVASVLGIAAMLTSASVGLASPNIVAGPVTNPATGNTYYLVGNTNWYDAEAQAEQLGGHLATDRSPAEDAWIRANIAPLTAPFFDSPAVWFGLTDQAHEGTFTWVSGESTPGWPSAVFDTPFFNAFPWRNSGEPNGGTSENCAYFDLDPLPFGGWVDYPCAGGDPLLGLVEVDGPPPPPQPQTITFPPVFGAVVGGGIDLGTVATGGPSGTPLSFSVDGSSTPGACSVSGSVVSFTAVGSCVIDANQAGSALYSAAPQVQQSIPVGKGTPSISWSPAALDFGTPLGAAQLDATAGIGGTFTYTPAAGTVLNAGTQTLSVVFTPSDTVDWNGASLSVPITVATTVAPITGSSSGPVNVGPGGSAAIVGGSANGPVSVGVGGSLFIGSGGSVSGPLTIAPGATLVIDNGSVTGPVRATGDLYLTLCGATVTGPLTVTGSSHSIVVGSTDGCAGNTFNGPVSITKNTGGVSFVGNTVNASATIQTNSGGFSYSGNTFTGKPKVSGNS